MLFSGKIVSNIFEGKYTEAIKTWNTTLAKLLKSEPDTWSYTQFNNLYSTMGYILYADSFVKGVVNKRMNLLRAYDWQVQTMQKGECSVSGNAETLKTFTQNHIETLHKILYNLVFFGKCLVEVKKDNYGYNYNINIIKPQTYYKNDGEFFFLNDDEYPLDDLIYFGDELIDISAIAISITKQSMTKEHCDSLWYNNSQYLNGYVHTMATKDTLTALGNEETVNSVGEKLVSDIVRLPQSGGVLHTPEGMEATHKDIVNTSIGKEYELFIKKKEREIENIIFGRSTQENDTTYASEKLRYENTSDIQFADILTFQQIVTTILNKVKWDYSIMEAVEFKVNVATDDDEMKLTTVLNGIKSLELKDSNGNAPEIEVEWLKKSTNIPFLNDGTFKLEKQAQPAYNSWQ